MLIINNAGYNYRHPHPFSIYRPHGSGDYLLLIVRTNAYVVLGGEKNLVKENNAILFRKNSPQIYGALKEEYVNDWVHFDVDAAEESRISALGIPFDTPIPLQEGILLSELIRNIVVEHRSNNLRKDDSAKYYFQLTLLKLSEKILDRREQPRHPYYEILCKVRNDLQAEPQRHRNIEAISKEVNLSHSYLQHLYKSFFGISIMADIRNSRVEHAKYLLSATNLTVASISESCGYHNEVHFMRIFKKTTGLTPSQYREKSH